MSRRSLTIAITLLLLATACGGGAQQQQSARDQLPEITLDSLREDLNGEWVKVPAADGKSKPLNPWVFNHSEPKEVKILEQKTEGETPIFLIEISTRSAPNSKTHYSLSGQLRLHYRLDSGLVLRKWEIDQIDNISFKYVNEQPTPDANSNADEGNSNGRPKAGANANGAGDKSNANQNEAARTKN